MEEKFSEINHLDDYYKANQSNKDLDNKYNPWALPVQFQFLHHRHQNELDQKKYEQKVIILDRCIYEDYFVFAKSIHQLKYISEEEWEEYREKYFELIKEVRPPEILIFLNASSGELLR